jgi:HlyD family secretion protein
MDQVLSPPISAVVPTNPTATTSPSTHSARNDRPRGGLIAKTLGLSALGGLGLAAWTWLAPTFQHQENPLLELPRMTVAKVDISTELNAFGRVESSQNTIISCELERLEIRTQGGRSMSSGGASTILTLVEEGTNVKAGDILCTLDSSEYEELVRTQEIKTEQAAAAQKQAHLNFEIAELAVHEYKEGLYDQQRQTMEGTIALAKSDHERALDRLKWTRKMLEKGYVSIASKASDERTLSQSEQDVLTSRFDLTNFLEYSHNKTLMELSAEVEKRRFEYLANDQRVTRSRDQLAYYKKMVEKCTVRAPHDGFLIYAYDPFKSSNGAIEAGQTVRQGQKLFFLPDLGKMEVSAYIHESVASRVHEGMRAKAKIEGLMNQTLEGHVTKVEPLPNTGGNWWSDEVKYFMGVVKLDSVPSGLKPGMTAEIIFEVDRCFDVLAVPNEAVAVEGGHSICYVAGPDGLERRPVTLGRSNRELLEVTKGLAEGDQVVLNPEKMGVSDSISAQQVTESPFDESSTNGPAAGSGGPVSVE